jgi:hypothetical protein
MASIEQIGTVLFAVNTNPVNRTDLKIMRTRKVRKKENAEINGYQRQSCSVPWGSSLERTTIEFMYPLYNISKEKSKGIFSLLSSSTNLTNKTLQFRAARVPVQKLTFPQMVNKLFVIYLNEGAWGSVVVQALRN